MNPRQQVRMTAWIPCEDDMPPAGDTVLFFHRDGFIRVGEWLDPYQGNTPPREEWEIGSWWSGEWSYEKSSVTHWAFCPEPPH